MGDPAQPAHLRLVRDGDGLRGRLLLRQALLLIAVFAAATGIAELAGAENLGTALAFGQIAFAIALVYVLLRG